MSFQIHPNRVTIFSQGVTASSISTSNLNLNGVNHITLGDTETVFNQEITSNRQARFFFGFNAKINDIDHIKLDQNEQTISHLNLVDCTLVGDIDQTKKIYFNPDAQQADSVQTIHSLASEDQTTVIPDTAGVANNFVLTNVPQTVSNKILVNTAFGVGGSSVTRIDYYRIPYANIQINPNFFINYQLIFNEEFDTIPLLFGCMSDGGTSTEYNRVLISFSNITTTSAYLFIQNLSTVTQVTGQLAIGVQAIQFT